MKAIGIILAGGYGKRMEENIPKQYLKLGGNPVLYYSITAFEKSLVSSVIIVADADHAEYCRREIVEKYGFKKVLKVVTGGEERWLSSLEGIKASEGGDIVLIHDGARPFVTEDMINRNIEAAAEKGACITAVKAFETIKYAEDGIIKETPPREKMYIAQTPQSFNREKILKAYDIVISQKDTEGITDDAMVWERAGMGPVFIVEGSRDNLKITTREDMAIAESILSLKAEKA